MSSPTKVPRRLAWVTGLRPEKAAYYEKLHANPMPGVNEMIKACKLQNVSVHKFEIEGKFTFSYTPSTPVKTWMRTWREWRPTRPPNAGGRKQIPANSRSRLRLRRAKPGLTQRRSISSHELT